MEEIFRIHCALFYIIKVNEAENQKKESWLTHQKMYKSYQEIEKTAKTMEGKLKNSVEKARWVVSHIEISLVILYFCGIT